MHTHRSGNAYHTNKQNQTSRAGTHKKKQTDTQTKYCSKFHNLMSLNSFLIGCLNELEDMKSDAT